MTKTELKGCWNGLKGKLKQQFEVLTDNDLMCDEGKEEEMYGRLQHKLRKTKEQLFKHLSELQSPRPCPIGMVSSNSSVLERL